VRWATIVQFGAVVACSGRDPAPAPPADCALVAEVLASFDLGNYAPVEERAPVVAKYRRLCEDQQLTRDEGECVTKARDRSLVARCAPRLFPELAPSGNTGDCVEVAAKIRASYGPQGSAFEADPTMSRWFDTTMRIVRESCEQDRWPDPVKRCILGATDVTGCNTAMPADLQQKLQDRMNAAMQAFQP
jgi:hypothetical protein